MRHRGQSGRRTRWLAPLSSVEIQTPLSATRVTTLWCFAGVQCSCVDAGLWATWRLLPSRVALRISCVRRPSNSERPAAAASKTVCPTRWRNSLYYYYYSATMYQDSQTFVTNMFLHCNKHRVKHEEALLVLRISRPLIWFWLCV